MPWPTPNPVAATARGLYRLRRPEGPSLIYIGEGQIAGRLASHRARGLGGTHRQSALLSGPLLHSAVVLDDTPTRHLLEFENDLIASHMLAFKQPPEAQYLG
jgi:hypothetical protein